MVGFDFNTKAHWNSGFKNNVVGDDDAPMIDADKLAIAPEFFDNIDGGRKSGWLEHVDDLSTITDTVGTPDYMRLYHSINDCFAHVQRVPPAAILPPLSNKFKAVSHLYVEGLNIITWYQLGWAIYFDVDNWIRIRMAIGFPPNLIIVEANVNGTITDYTDGGPHSISLDTWYEVRLDLTWDGDQWKFDAYYRIPHGSWTNIGRGGPFPSFDFNPTWIISGCGYSWNPDYPIAHFNNSLGVGGTPRYHRMSMFGLWPLNGHAGSWQSPTIPCPTDQQLGKVILEQDYGSEEKYISKVNILRASDDVVLSTWEGTLTGDGVLYREDFDNGFAVTENVDIKVEVWLWSEDLLDWSELDRVAGDFLFVWKPEESLGLSDELSREVKWSASESLGLTDKILSSVTTTFEEGLGLSDKETINVTALMQEALGLSDVETVEMTAILQEALGLSDASPMTVSITLLETLGLSDDIFQLSEVLSGIKGLIAPLLDITNFDFCEMVNESGHIVTKKGTPDEDFQAFFYRKQTSQSFDIAIKTFPGDGVMFFCPELEITIEVGDTLEYNALEYEVIAIREKEHDGNMIYKKAACRFLRDVGVPQVTNPAATSPTAGQALATWDEVETTQFPAFDHYELWMKKGAGSWQLIIETAGVSHSQRNLAADTYYFKIRAIDKVGLQGSFSSEVNAVVA